MEKQDTVMREAIPAKLRLALTLRYLASGELSGVKERLSSEEEKIAWFSSEECTCLQECCRFDLLFLSNQAVPKQSKSNLNEEDDGKAEESQSEVECHAGELSGVKERLSSEEEKIAWFSSEECTQACFDLFCAMDAAKNDPWSRETLRELFSLYKERENLWNCKHPSYYKSNVRDASLNEIATQLGVASKEVYKKFHNHRTQWDLLFLSNQAVPKQSKSNLNEEDDGKAEESQSEVTVGDGEPEAKKKPRQKKGDEIMNRALEDIGGLTKSHKALQLGDGEPKAKKKPRQKKGDEIMNRALEEIGGLTKVAQSLAASRSKPQQHEQPPKEIKEHDGFCMDLAAELRTLQDPKLVSFLKFKIQELMFQAKCGILLLARKKNARLV
ncbi:unnamed protein product [Darwinula stevensoni]|uniref:MADF domain-containing protein n=1 Tax=Darwinula stevensoni TaxID=69355 RepID=A0A7R9A3T6_9CRUS|nr:unnamed protein product [Darwinula stevensoni]CAG0882816.1 unnamed protein product [Darwinula stevensoni]